MIYESRCFWHPKDLEYEKDYEDAFEVGNHGIVAIADGVSSAIFSRRWARILTRQILESQPDVDNVAALHDWLAELRRTWAESLDLSGLNYFQKMKLQETGGAYSTLLWVELIPEQEAGPADSVQFRFVGHAVGDCCLFHVRNGKLLDKFPIENAADFEADPITICSTDRGRDHRLEFKRVEGVCQSGDLILLASDAFALWAYYQIEAERRIDWEELWDMTPETWTQKVSMLRGLSPDERMRVDDTTLVMLRMATPAQLNAEQDSKELPAAVVIGALPEVDASGEDRIGLEEPAEATTATVDGASIPSGDEEASVEVKDHDAPGQCEFSDEGAQPLKLGTEEVEEANKLRTGELENEVDTGHTLDAAPSEESNLTGTDMESSDREEINEETTEDQGTNMCCRLRAGFHRIWSRRSSR